MSERRVQYEFKVIVQVSEDAWPGEVRQDIESAISDYVYASETGMKVQSVERISDY